MNAHSSSAAYYRAVRRSIRTGVLATVAFAAIAALSTWLTVPYAGVLLLAFLWPALGIFAPVLGMMDTTVAIVASATSWVVLLSLLHFACSRCRRSEREFAA